MLVSPDNGQSDDVNVLGVDRRVRLAERDAGTVLSRKSPDIRYGQPRKMQKYHSQ